MKITATLALCGFLFSSTSLACCTGILNAATRVTAVWAALFEGLSAGTAYFSIQGAQSDEQQRAYWAQTGAYGASAVGLGLAISCRPIGGMSVCSGGIATVAALAGLGSSVVGYFQNHQRPLLEEITFYSGLTGITAHVLSISSAVMLSSCYAANYADNTQLTQPIVVL